MNLLDVGALLTLSAAVPMLIIAMVNKRPPDWVLWAVVFLVGAGFACTVVGL